MLLIIKDGSLEEKLDSFIRHRIYDSPETIASKQVYNSADPTYCHEQSMSVTPGALAKMNRVPLVIEMWRL